MHQRIPRWKSICWCSQNWKHCIWISTKGTLQFTWVLLSLAYVVKEGEFLLSYLWNLCEKKSSYVIPSQREITERGRIFGILKGKLKEDVFSNFILLWHVVLPSMPKREIVGYNWLIAWLSLMLHKCHISHQTKSTELRWFARQFIVFTEITR